MFEDEDMKKAYEIYRSGKKPSYSRSIVDYITALW